MSRLKRDLLFIGIPTLVALILFILLLTQGCTGYLQKDKDGNYIPPNFQDGTWSSCTYSSKNGRVVTVPPVQLRGAPMEWTEPDGTSVKCKSILKLSPV